MTLDLDALPLARQIVDRDDEARGRADLFDELLAESTTRVLPLRGSKILIGAGGLRLLTADEVTTGLVRVYLGRTLEAQGAEPAGTAVILAVLTDAAAAELQPDDGAWQGLRDAAALLGERDAGLAAEALAIANWHASHVHCPHCGSPTVVEHGGWVRRCLADGREIFPRTDPAVIVGVLDDRDRILLGSNAAWEGNRWSLLAGFVEPGESFESAVKREIHEEAGVRVVDPEYLGSQPWPFPASVMVGFTARLAPDQHPDEFEADGREILAVRWFTREEIWDERESILLPGGVSIAHAIVKHWYGGELDAPSPLVALAR